MSSNFGFQKVNPRAATIANNINGETTNHHNTSTASLAGLASFADFQQNNLSTNNNAQQTYSAVEGSLCFVPTTQKQNFEHANNQSEESPSSNLLAQNGMYYLPFQQVRIDIPMWKIFEQQDGDDETELSEHANNEKFEENNDENENLTQLKKRFLNNNPNLFVGNNNNSKLQQKSLKKIIQILEKPAKSYHWEGEALIVSSSASTSHSNQHQNSNNNNNNTNSLFSTTTLSSLSNFLEAFTDLHRKFMKRIRLTREKISAMNKRKSVQFARLSNNSWNNAGRESKVHDESLLPNSFSFLSRDKDCSKEYENNNNNKSNRENIQDQNDAARQQQQEEKIKQFRKRQQELFFQEQQIKIGKNNFDDFDGFYLECIDHPIWKSFLIFFFCENEYPMIMITSNSLTFRDTLQRYCSCVGVKIDWYGEACFLGAASGPKNNNNPEDFYSNNHSSEANQNHHQQSRKLSSQSLVSALQNLPFDFEKNTGNGGNSENRKNVSPSSTTSSTSASILGQASAASLASQHPGNVASMIIFDFLAHLHEIHSFQKIVADVLDDDNDDDGDKNREQENYDVNQQQRKPGEVVEFNGSATGRKNNVVNSVEKPVAPQHLFNNDTVNANKNQNLKNSHLNAFEKEILATATSSSSAHNSSFLSLFEGEGGFSEESGNFYSNNDNNNDEIDLITDEQVLKNNRARNGGSNTRGMMKNMNNNNNLNKSTSGNNNTTNNENKKIVGINTGIPPVHPYLSIVSGFPFHGGEMRQAPVKCQVHTNLKKQTSTITTSPPEQHENDLAEEHEKKSGNKSQELESTITFLIGSGYDQASLLSSTSGSSSSSSSSSTFTSTSTKNEAVLLPNFLPYIMRNIFSTNPRTSALLQKDEDDAEEEDHEFVRFFARNNNNNNRNSNGSNSSNNLKNSAQMMINHLSVSFLPYLGRGSHPLRKMIVHEQQQQLQLQRKNSSSILHNNKSNANPNMNSNNNNSSIQQFGAFGATSTSSSAIIGTNAIIGGVFHTLTKPATCSLDFSILLPSSSSNSSLQPPYIFINHDRNKNNHNSSSFESSSTLFRGGKIIPLSLITSRNSSSSSTTKTSTSNNHNQPMLFFSTSPTALDVLSSLFRRKKIAAGSCLWTALSRISCDPWLSENSQTGNVLTEDQYLDSEFLLRSIEVRRFSGSHYFYRSCNHRHDDGRRRQRGGERSEEDNDDGRIVIFEDDLLPFQTFVSVDVLKTDF